MLVWRDLEEMPLIVEVEFALVLPAVVPVVTKRTSDSCMPNYTILFGEIRLDQLVVV